MVCCIRHNEIHQQLIINACVHVFTKCVKGKMWCVIKKMEVSRSAVFLEGETSAVFRLQQGVAYGCSLSPILFSVFTNDLLEEVEQLGVQLSSSKKIGGMLFAIAFVGVSDSKESLQK